MNIIHLKSLPSKFFHRISLTVLLSLLILPVVAQENSIHQDPDLLLKQAIQLYQKELYADAQPLLEKYLQELPSHNHSSNQLNVDNAHYYHLVCAFYLDQPGAVSHAEKYIKKTSSLANKQKMSYELGHYFFKKKEYEKAIPYYEQAGIDNFSNEEIAKKKFEQAYAYFNLQEFDKALPLFNSVKNIHNDYYLPANYYTGYISLLNKDYDNALKSFKKVVNKPQYKKVVPYYMAEIYYYRSQYDKLLKYAQPYIENGELYYDEDLRHLIGQTYFEKKEYKKALPYLEEYEMQAKTLQKEEVYQLAYSYYKTGQLENAIAGFKQLSDGKDSLAQNAMYILGDCYLKTGQKSEARQAFAFGARSSYNPKQQEVSKFNYGKLSYELGYQDVALSTLQNFVEDYPQSEFNSESREILAQLFMNTEDYKDALSVIKDLPKNQESIKTAFQRITFGRAMQLINDGNLTQADRLLDQSLQYPMDSKIVQLSYFWKGELALRSDQPENAIPYLQKYISDESHPASGEANLQTAHYDLGYSYLKNGQYNKAIPHFQKAQHTFGARGNTIANDARLREGDSYYMLKDYGKATKMYDEVIQNGGAGSDYAVYQKAIIAGIGGDSQQKVNLLSQISSNHPTSSYKGEAGYQIGLTYMAEEKYRQAIPYFQEIAKDKNHPNSSKAALKLALAYYKMGENDKATAQYKKLIENYSHSVQAREAMVSLKNIYLNEGQPQEYISYLKSIGKTLNASEEDSLTYASAESSFADERYPAAVQQFTKYLTDFPDGHFKSKAHFYRAESAYREEDYSQAAKDYEYVISNGNSEFLEHASKQAAYIHFYKQNDYKKALQDYKQLKTSSTTKKHTLTALRGVLRSNYELENWKDVVSSAQDLLNLEDISTGDQIVSYFYLGRAAQEQQDCATAIQQYQKVADLTTSELGAESRYYIALCRYQQEDLKNAEEAAFEVIKKTPSYDFWVAKSYVLLGQIFWKEEDYFNAKATLQSIIDHSEITEIVEEAKDVLQQVKTDEQKQSKIKKSSSPS